jgi:microcystin-dependent protein
MTIENIQIPQVGDTNYQAKLESSLNAIDAHDHSNNKGEPVKKIASAAVDNSTVEVDGSNKLRLKLAGLGAAKFSGGIAPVGTVVSYVGTSAPSGWLLCHGVAVNRTTYAGLFAIISTSWGEGDGSTTFNLPDMRGLFLRGRDRGAGNDPNAATRTAIATGGATGDNAGSYQDDEVKQHTHTGALTSSTRGYDNSGSVGFSAGQHGDSGVLSASSNAVTGMTAGTYKEGSANSNESRPVNVAVNWIIKY